MIEEDGGIHPVRKGIARGLGLREGRVSCLPVPMSDSAPEFRYRDPLHGITLEMMLHHLVDYYGWPGLADRIPVRCFMFDPSITSSLKFLRRTPWARQKIETLYRQAVSG